MEVSVFRFQLPCFFFLTPDTLRFGAWNLIFCNAPPLHYSISQISKSLKYHSLRQKRLFKNTMQIRNVSGNGLKEEWWSSSS